MNRDAAPTMKPNEPSAFRIYWEEYGRWKALGSSIYLWAALLLTIICYGLWSKEGWWEDIIAIIPSLIGFSLAAFAMLLAFTNEQFLKVVTTPLPGKTEGKSKASIYGSTAAAFVHFILVQFFALCAALICKALTTPPTWLVGLMHKTGLTSILRESVWFLAYWLFLYSVLSGIAATLRVFMLAYWFNKAAQLPPPDPGAK